MPWCSVRRLLAAAGIAGAAMLAFAGSGLPVQAAPASTEFGSDGSVGVIVNFDGQCLDQRSGQSTAQTQVEPCNGSSEQRWAWHTGINGGFTVEDQRFHLCLTILNHYTGVGGKVVPTTCVRTDSFQQWELVDLTADGVEITNLADHGFVMHPAVCTSAIGAEQYMNASDQCRVDFWHG
jgi:Ricin-type beta-trefoil lectin domain